MHLRTALISAAVATALTGAAPAGAVDLIGVDQAAPVDCLATSLHVSTTDDYMSPSGGVITSVTAQRNATADGKHWAVKLVRDGAGTKAVVASSALLTAVVGSATYPMQLRAQAGDRLAIWIPEAEGHQCAFSSTSPIFLFSSLLEPTVGTVFSTSSGPPNRKLGLQAKLEADADGDGFGDETQDACPAVADRQALPCGTATVLTTIKQCVVPSLKGKTKAGAKKALAAGGCKLGKTKTKKIRHYGKARRPGHVARQSIEAKTARPMGTVVDIAVYAKKAK